MDSYSAVILLALLALGHASPLTTVHQIPRTNEEMFSEALTDGFLVDQNLLTSSPTTQAPRKETTPLATTEGEETGPEAGAADEGSAMGEGIVKTFPNSTVLPTQGPAGMTSSAQPGVKSATEASEHTSEMVPTVDPVLGLTEEGSGDLVTTPTRTSTEVFFLVSGLPDPEGSGVSEEPLSTTTSVPEPNLFDTAFEPRLEESVGKPVVGSSIMTENTGFESPTELPKGHVTPDWIIIVGFLVGVAVLVVLCVAIATRDKWNRPNQYNKTIVTPNQQGAVEMQTFLPAETPKENGKAEEYTVIPLDELPHEYSS